MYERVLYKMLPLQLEDSKSLKKTFNKLWREEGIRFLHKGLTARTASAAPNSAILITSYEWVKRKSLRTDLQYH